MENTNKKLQIVFGDAVLGVHGKDFHYLSLIPEAEWSPW